jgi:hypothetical protein
MGWFEKDADDVAAAIKSWVTGPFLSEARCRDSLARHLQACFPAHKVELEFRMGMQIADIFIDFRNWIGDGTRVVVELKYDLQEMNECNRLVGQIGGYIDSGSDVVVLLCGETKPELAQCVVKRLATFTGEKLFRKGQVFTGAPNYPWPGWSLRGGATWALAARVGLATARQSDVIGKNAEGADALR